MTPRIDAERILGGYNASERQSGIVLPFRSSEAVAAHFLRFPSMWAFRVVQGLTRSARAAAIGRGRPRLAVPWTLSVPWTLAIASRVRVTLERPRLAITSKATGVGLAMQGLPSPCRLHAIP